MALSIYQSVAPAFVRTLKALDTIFPKVAAVAEGEHFHASGLLKVRLFPDMFKSTREV